MNLAMKRILLLLVVVLIISPNGTFGSKSCSKDTQCGSNIKYHACIQKRCSDCSKDSQCNLNKSDVCHSDGYCMMESVLSHLSLKEIITGIAIFLGSIIAAGGGLGGGGVFVPIFLLIMEFDAKSAAALSQATIFGGSIINLLMNFREQHPIRKHRTLADLPTILILAPLLLGGAVLGVILNQIMPDVIIVILMIVILAYAAFRTFRKAIKLWKKENEDREKRKIALNYQNQAMLKQDQLYEQQEQYRKQREKIHTDPPYDSLHDQQGSGPYSESFDKPAANAYPNAMENIEYGSQFSSLTQNQNNRNKNTHAQTHPNPHTHASVNPNDNLISNPMNDNFHKSSFSNTTESETTWVVKVARQAGQDSNYLQMKLNQRELYNLEKLMKQEAQIMKPLLVILLVWCIVCVFSLLRSTKIIVDLNCGSLTYWIVVIGIFPFLMVITGIIAYREVKSYRKKLMLYWMPCEGDIEWNFRRAILYPLIAMFAGLLGGLLGIGGGMIVSPLLLELGVKPRVAAATSAIAVMITASSSILQKYLEDMIRTDWMLEYIIVGMIGTFFGQTLFNHFVRKYNRTSLVVFAVASIIGLAVILMGIDGIMNMVWKPEFDSLC